MNRSYFFAFVVVSIPTVGHAAEHLAQEMSALSIKSGVVHFVVAKPGTVADKLAKSGDMPAKSCLKPAGSEAKKEDASGEHFKIVRQRPAVQLVNGRPRVNSVAKPSPEEVEFLAKKYEEAALADKALEDADMAAEGNCESE